jgi:DNA transformation protein
MQKFANFVSSGTRTAECTKSEHSGVRARAGAQPEPSDDEARGAGESLTRSNESPKLLRIQNNKVSRDISFHDYVVYDLLGDLSGISSRAMFSGYAIYKDGKIFAIIVDGELYLKGRKETENFFKSQESRQFTYTKNGGKTYKMNYWFVPEEVFENRDTLAEWIDKAI